MPVEGKDWEEKGTSVDKKIGIVILKVQNLLKSDPDKAYTTQDLVKELSVAIPSASNAVRVLNSQGLVERKKVKGLIYNKWKTEAW